MLAAETKQRMTYINIVPVILKVIRNLQVFHVLIHFKYEQHQIDYHRLGKACFSK